MPLADLPAVLALAGLLLVAYVHPRPWVETAAAAGAVVLLLRVWQPAEELTVDGVHLTYRPLRPVGERHELYRTNRDYLGVLRAVGTDQATVDRVSAGFLAARRWEIQP